MSYKNEDYLNYFKESLLYDDVKAYADILPQTVSKEYYKSNLLPGHKKIGNTLFTPVYMS
jgi:hypothetical protein